MELKIDKQVENKLLNRLEVTFSGKSDGATPSRGDVKSAIQQSLKVDGDLIVIDRIVSRYGTNDIFGRAMVYNDKGSMGLEPKYKLKRGGKGTKESKAEEKKEEPEPKPKVKAKESEAPKKEDAKKEKPEAKGKDDAPKEEPKAEAKKEG